jgi:arginine/lysine/ornithine decarboxylase
MPQNRTPLMDAVQQVIKKNPISFHVPGHKHGQLFDGASLAFKQHLLQYDLTELNGLDDLHAPEAAIMESQQLLTKFYRTKASYYLVNGSTAGNLAMILATFREGDRVLVQRNCHKSVLNGLELVKANPVFIAPTYDETYGVPRGVNVRTVREVWKQYDDIKGIILTYPNYYGMIYELKDIIDFAHEQHVPVLVDEAHGPHFVLGSPFPKSALQLGGDIVVHSAHKMLPAMTMGSFLHINSDRVSKERIEHFLSILQTSSPSYPIMISLEWSRLYLEQYSLEDIEYTMNMVTTFTNEIKKMDGFDILLGDDPLKLLLRAEGYSGFELQAFLEDYGIYSELADPYHVLWIFPLLKKEHTYPLHRVIDVLARLPKKTMFKRRVNKFFIQQVTELAVPIHQQQLETGEWVPLKKAIGQIADGMIIPYPPGIPLLLRGERITEEIIVEIEQLLMEGCHFQGSINKQNGTIRIMKV